MMGAPQCEGLSALFFSDQADDVERAKSVCATCAEARACLRGALERREACGVWGGELVRFGVVLEETPRRGRPPKAA